MGGVGWEVRESDREREREQDRKRIRGKKERKKKREKLCYNKKKLCYAWSDRAIGPQC